MFKNLTDGELQELTCMLSAAVYATDDADLSNEMADLFTEAECEWAGREGPWVQ